MVRPPLSPAERARGERLGAILRQARGTRSMADVAAESGVPVETLRKIAHELVRGGASMSDVILTRVYVTDISRFEEVGRAHGEGFAEHRPLMTGLEVSALIDPRMLVEIETVAYAG